MKLEELLENFKKQETELSKKVADLSQELAVNRENLLRLYGAIEGVQIAIKQQDSPSQENQGGESEVAKTEVLPD